MSSGRRFRALRGGGVFALALLVSVGLARGQEAPPSTSTAPPPKERVPVAIQGKTLFYLQERVFSFSPADRARAIEERIRKLSRAPREQIESIAVEDAETGSEVVAGDLVVMTVTDRDAQAVGRDRHELAVEYANAIRSVVLDLQRRYNLKTILLGVLSTLIATGILLLALKALGAFFPRVYRKLESWRGTHIRSIRIQKLELLTGDRIADTLRGLVKILRAAVILLLLYFYIPLVFSFFPWTRGYAAKLFDYILSPIQAVLGAAVAFLPNLFFILVILTVAYYLIKFVKFLFVEIEKETISIPGFYPDWAPPTFNIARFLVIAFTAVVVFPYLPGSESPAFQGVSIFLGLLFSLGSSSAVANVVAGLLLTYTRALQIGDRVKIADTVGDVTEKTLLVTRIRTIKNVDISIPNAMVLSSHIINYSSSAREEGLILHTGVTIGYDAPWRKVHQLLVDAALATEDILKEPAPFVLQTSLDDFYVTYQLNAFTDKPGIMADIYSELHQNIQDKFNEGGVEIMSPHYSQIRDGNVTTTPAEYRPKNYEPPSFRIGPLEKSFGRKGGDI